MGKKFRPSNGTQGECFKSAFCYKCKKMDLEKDKYCTIEMDTMMLDVQDEEYPREWTYDSEGNPTCTAFKDREEFNAEQRAKRKIAAPIRCKNTIDLFNT